MLPTANRTVINAGVVPPPVVPDYWKTNANYAPTARYLWTNAMSDGSTPAVTTQSAKSQIIPSLYWPNTDPHNQHLTGTGFRCLTIDLLFISDSIFRRLSPLLRKSLLDHGTRADFTKAFMWQIWVKLDRWSGEKKFHAYSALRQELLLQILSGDAKFRRSVPAFGAHTNRTMTEKYLLTAVGGPEYIEESKKYDYYSPDALIPIADKFPTFPTTRLRTLESQENASSTQDFTPDIPPIRDSRTRVMASPLRTRKHKRITSKRRIQNG